MDGDLDDSAARFVAHTGVVCRRIANETLLVPVASQVGDLDAIYTLSALGSTVWTLLREPVSARQIVDAICAEYDVSRDVAQKDVAEFLDALLAKKLVEAVDGCEA